MRTFLFLILVLHTTGSFAQDFLRVLASGSWTAAYARSAGADSVDILAPTNLLHPSEYELSIHDMQKINQAGLIIYGGYEVAIAQMKKMLNLDPEKYLAIETNYTEKSIAESLLKIAQRLGSEAQARKSVAEIGALFREARRQVEQLGLKGKPVLVHFFQEAFIRELGMIPAGIIGPAPLEVYEIAGMAKKECVLIIDNVHNPVAQPLKEILKQTPVVELVNFPGYAGTTTLESVIRYNLEQIIQSQTNP